jgi:hypothetical protein
MKRLIVFLIALAVFNFLFLMWMNNYYQQAYTVRNSEFNYSVSFACTMGVYRQDYTFEFARDQSLSTVFQFRPVSDWTYCETCREVRPFNNGWVRI